jgi:hypothetical protein
MEELLVVQYEIAETVELVDGNSNEGKAYSDSSNEVRMPHHLKLQEMTMEFFA